MYIKKIRIKNFRSIKEQEFECSKFNVFIGKNNHGKSNIFQALDWFFKNEGDINEIKTKNNEENLEPEVEIVFGDAQEGLSTMQDENKVSRIQKHININEISFTRKISEGRSKLVLSSENKNPTGIDGAILDYLPKFRYIDAREHIDKHDGYKKNNIIGELLTHIVENISKNEKFQEFKKSFGEFVKHTFQEEVGKNISTEIKKYLNEQFEGTIQDFNFKLGAPKFEDLMKNFTISLNDGVETKIDEKGDGIQRGLVFAMFRYLSEGKNKIKNTIFCIDEVENHLHVSTQRIMENSFYKMIEKNNQVFINTHSPVFMTNKEDKKIFKVEKNEDNETEIDDKSSFHKILYEILGGMPSDYLFPDNFLIIEGESDKIFIENVIEKHYTEHKNKIQIVAARGNSNLNCVNYFFEYFIKAGPYKDKVVVLADKGKDGEIYEKIKREIGGRFFELNKEDLELYYPEKYLNYLDDKEKSMIYNFKKLKKGEIEKYEKHSEDNKKNKCSIANKIGKVITKEDFEKEMSIIYNALEKVWLK